MIVIDTYVHDKKIYFSFLENKNSCLTLNIIFAKINSEILNFQNYYNSTELQQMRKGFAKDNSYVSQFGRIAQKLKELGSEFFLLKKKMDARSI